MIFKIDGRHTENILLPVGSNPDLLSMAGVAKNLSVCIDISDFGDQYGIFCRNHLATDYVEVGGKNIYNIDFVQFNNYFSLTGKRT